MGRVRDQLLFDFRSCLAHEAPQFLEFEGFIEDRRALGLRIRDYLRRPKGSHQDQCRGGQQLPKRPQERQVIHVWQPQVEHDDPKGSSGGGHHAKRSSRIRRLLDVVPAVG